MPWSTLTQVSVGTTSVTALAANSDRSYAIFQNNGSTVLYLRLDGGTATTSSGVRLNALGGSYEMSGSLGNLENGLITAIGDAAGGSLLVAQKTH